MNEAPKPLLVLFDGNGLIHRAFHALPPFTCAKPGKWWARFTASLAIMLKAH